jgi:hypothetical protein
LFWKELSKTSREGVNHTLHTLHNLTGDSTTRDVNKKPFLLDPFLKCGLVKKEKESQKEKKKKKKRD